MNTIDPFAIRVAIERAAIIRLIKAHAKDCERRGARSLGHGYLALVSEIEDAMQHDSAHVEALENFVPPLYTYRGRDCRNRAWYVGGEDTAPHGGVGVLEWCNDEQDAKERMGIMARYPQFKGLYATTRAMVGSPSLLASIGKWED